MAFDCVPGADGAVITIMRMRKIMSMSSNMVLIIRAECDEYILIFEYSNILVTNIYSDIHSYQIFLYEYIRIFIRVKFVCTNIFGHLFVSNLIVQVYSDIRL